MISISISTTIVIDIQVRQVKQVLQEIQVIRVMQVRLAQLRDSAYALYWRQAE